MAIFSKKESLIEIETLKTQLAEANQKVTDLETQVIESDETAVLARSQVEGFEEQIKTLTTSNESLQNDLTEANEKLESFDGKVEARAIEIAASAGADPIPAAKSDEDMESDLKARYAQMQPGQERMDFRKANAKFLN